MTLHVSVVLDDTVRRQRPNAGVLWYAFPFVLQHW